MSMSRIVRRVLIACGFGLLAMPVAAGDGMKPTGVVELFTSQGCSSCPPADAALKTLIDAGKVVALAYHVDYWNYLGWTDTLGSKDNTARQYAYAKALGRNGVYTPQAVLNGRDHVNGADLKGINSRLATMSNGGQGLAVDVDAGMRGDEVDINVGAGRGKANVVVVYFKRQQLVDVQKGENGGRKIPYWHAVSDVQTIGMWDGTPSRFVLPSSILKQDKNGGFAVLLQEMTEDGSPSAILGATTLLANDVSN